MVFSTFFLALRQAGIPVSLTEYLSLVGVMAHDQALTGYNVDNFYYLARATLVKDERFYDRFDRVFSAYYKGVETLFDELDLDAVPDDWLRRQAELTLSDEEKRRLEATLGDWNQLMATLRQRLVEQRQRHQGGNKWIGTAGRSPFGAFGDSPEGVRIGQHRTRQRQAVKVWDRRTFRNFDDSVELGTRTIKVALRKLRRFARSGAAEELDLGNTIHATARNAGLLDLKLVAPRHNAVKVLLFLDVGGSMDDHIQQVEELFSAARSEFKHLEYFYFHNCVYDAVWKNNRRRHQERLPTLEVLRTFGRDYKLIIVGDASMSPYEITQVGGSVEAMNDEPGAVWLTRLVRAFPSSVWLNPLPEAVWDYTQSVGLIAKIMQRQMFPLSLQGLEQAIDVRKRTR